MKPFQHKGLNSLSRKSPHKTQRKAHFNWVVIASFANYTEFSGEKKHLLSPWEYIAWYGKKNTELKLSDKESNLSVNFINTETVL